MNKKYKTKKKSSKKDSSLIKGTASFSGNIYGNIYLTEYTNKLQIEINLSGLPKNSLLGFHCHEAGDLSEKCHSCCAHFNPDNKEHGDLNDSNSHVGDFGNIQTDSMGHCKQLLYSNYARLQGKYSLIGRSLVIHGQEDDLGRTSHKDSKITGNSGERIACAVIGYSKDSQLYF